MTRPGTPQPLSVIEAVIPVAALILLGALANYLFGDADTLGPNQVALTLVNIIWLIVAALAFATTVITADQVVAIMLPGRMFKNMFEDRGLAPARLCRPKH